MTKVAALLTTFLLAACASAPPPDKFQHACNPQPGDIDPSAIGRPSGDVVAKVVRFTDDGEFVKRCELTDLLFELQSGGPQILLVYIHGWKHNGDPLDPDLTKFKQQLAEIRALEAARAIPRRVIGAYIAWNGKRTALPLVKELTFWGRMRAADRVSQSAAVTRLLGAIESVRRKRSKPDDLVIFVGHSFGARILYNAVAQVLIHRTELAHPGKYGGEYDMVEGIGDLVVLLNPAFEASLFTTFNALHRPEYRFKTTQPPLIVSIASETDKATKVAFPLGQTVSFNTSPKRRTTLGNFENYWTHRLVPRASSTAEHSVFCSADVCIETLPARNPAFPFISATADRTIIDGHNDVWNPKLRDFLAALIQRAGSPNPIVKP